LALLVCSLVVLVKCDPGDPPLPSVGGQFSVAIEATIQNLKQTLNLREWYDNVTKMGRYEIVSSTSDVAYIVNWANNEVFTVLDEAHCSSALFDLNKDPFGYLPNGYLGLEVLVRNSLPWGDTYIGQGVVRGVQCNGWTSTFNYVVNFTNVYYTSNMTITFGFALPTWGTQ